MLTSFINWNPSPSVFGLPINWYGLLFGSSFLFAWYLFKKFFTQERVPLFHLEKLAIWMSLATIIGARLGHVLFYQPEYYLQHPLEIPLVWKGGLASHGAAISLLVITWVYARRAKWKMLWLADRVAIPVALAGLTIRLGNFINQEIMGKETTAPYGVVFMGADQAAPMMTAKWKGDDVEVFLSPEEELAYGGPVLVQHSLDTLSWRDIGSVNLTRSHLKKPAMLTDHSPVKQRSTYRAVNAPLAQLVPITGQDSTDTRSGTVRHSFGGVDKAGHPLALLTSRWKGDSVVMELSHLPGLRSTSLAVYSSADGKQWSPIYRQVLHDTPTHEFRFAHAPGPEKQPKYWIVAGTDQLVTMQLFARHPAQLYEGFFNLLLFLFLLWRYNRKKGKVPHGMIFGEFMMLLFTSRLLIEFLKEEQTDFPLPVPLTMGQLLSIPFILIGLFFWLRARKLNITTSPSVQNWDELEAQRKKKGKDKKKDL